MITDSERRDVARRLRELHLGGGSKDLIERTLSDAIGAWHESGMSWDFITERLADLIEPSPSCEFWDSEGQECYSVRTVRTCQMSVADNGAYRCSECGHLQDDTYRGDKGWYPPEYCAHCGARVVGE